MSKKIILLLVLSFLLLYMSIPSTENFPVEEWAATSHNKPAMFYITGDGGLNNFSRGLCESLNKKGYDVFALNAKAYFWKGRTPQQTTDDINNYLSKKITGRNNKQLVLIGYSFGADVLPFVINRLSKDIQENIMASFIIASSGSTDFEIHWADFFGDNNKRSMDVVTEINKLSSENVVIIDASTETSLAVNKISLKKYKHEVLSGSHHFDGKTEEIAATILKHI